MIKPMLLLSLLALPALDIKPAQPRPAAVPIAAAPAAAEAENYNIDTAHSMVVFKIKHLSSSMSYGRFNDISGKFTYDEKEAGKCSIEMEVKTESVDTNVPDRDKHLRSADFLNAKQFPTVTFKSKSIKSTGKDAYEVAGDFTLCGVTKAITITANHIGSAKDPAGKFRRGFDLAFTIKRTEYGMKKLLEAAGDDVHLMINVEGVRQ